MLRGESGSVVRKVLEFDVECTREGRQSMEAFQK